MKTLVCFRVLALGHGAHAAFADAASRMQDHCRATAAKALNVSPDIVNVHFEGQRTGKTYAVNGDTESHTPVAFQCNYEADGKTTGEFVVNKPEGCPADVSQADRYKYPACN